MSRYTITVTGTTTGQGRSDPDAVIGYDPPLRTYFLQAFPHEETDEPGLWLGTHDRAFETLEDGVDRVFRSLHAGYESAAQIFEELFLTRGRAKQHDFLPGLERQGYFRDGSRPP